MARESLHSLAETARMILVSLADWHTFLLGTRGLVPILQCRTDSEIVVNCAMIDIFGRPLITAGPGPDAR